MYREEAKLCDQQQLAQRIERGYKMGDYEKTNAKPMFRVHSIRLADRPFIKCAFLLASLCALLPHLPLLDRLIPRTDRKHLLAFWPDAAVCHRTVMRRGDSEKTFGGRILVNGDSITEEREHGLQWCP